MTIRHAGIEDLNQVLAIVRDATQDMELHGINQWDDIYPSREILQADIEQREMYVLEHGGAVAGMVVFNEQQPTEYGGVSWDYPGPALIVHRLTVDPAYKRRGLATRMMEFAETIAGAKECAAIRLDAFTQNPGALSLYEKMGYRMAGNVQFRKGLFCCFEKKLDIRKADKPMAVFDLDGTLYKTECVSLRAVHSAIEDAGLADKDDDTIRSLFGYTTPELCAQLFPELSPEALSALSDRVRHYERSLIGSHGQLYEGIRDLLGFLKSGGWLIALCTNSSEPYVKTVLSGLNLWGFFDVVRWKTESSTKIANLREIANGREALTMMIGDRGLDIEAARANRIPSIGVSWGYGTPEEVGEATFAAGTVGDLKGVLCRCRVYHDLLASLKAKVSIGKQPSIVGINGVDTAGKTCFTKEFASYLRAYGYDVLCVHLDDFHNKAEKRAEGMNEIQAYIDNAFDLDKLESKIIAPFRKTGMLNTELTFLDLKTDDFSVKKTFIARKRTILLCEGTLLFRAPIDRHFDYRIFLDIPFPEVIRRAEVRDVPLYGERIIGSYQRKYIPIQQWYLKDMTPEARSDAVIDNTDFDYPRVERI